LKIDYYKKENDNLKKVINEKKSDVSALLKANTKLLYNFEELKNEVEE